MYFFYSVHPCIIARDNYKRIKSGERDLVRVYFAEDVSLLDLYRLTRLVQEAVETLCQGIRVHTQVLSPRTVVKIRGLPIWYPDGRIKPQSELRGMLFQYLILRDHVVEGQVSVRVNQHGEDVSSFTLLDNDYEIARTFHNCQVISIGQQTYDIHIITDSIFDPNATPEELAVSYRNNNKCLRLTEPERPNV